VKTEKPQHLAYKLRTQNSELKTIMDPIELGLPHREPFIFIDSVENLDRGTSAESIKTFSGQESFFAGHFPDNPVVPGVLLTEGMAQTAGIAMGGPNKSFFLTAIRSMKFLRPVKPGETIRFSASKVGDMTGLVQCNVSAYVGTELIADGQIILAQTGTASR
jgi:3-hydroxyacyl-[acyl-carrier-protein] dehydratase